MKFLALIALLTSVNSFAATTVTRTFDGKNAVCQIKGDVGRRSYKVELLSEKLTEDKREIELKVKLFKCAEVEGKLAIVASSASEVTNSYYLQANGELGLTKNTLVAATFFANDKNERPLAKTSLDLNSSESVVKFSFDKSLPTAFLTAVLKSNVELPTGEVVKDINEYFGGFVLKFE